MEPIQRKPRIIAVTPSSQPLPQQPAPQQPPQPVSPPAPQPSIPSLQPQRPREDNPLVRVMQEEALRDMRPSTPEPAAPRIISKTPATPAAPYVPQKQLSDVEIRQKIAVDQVQRQASLSSRFTAFFGGLFKKKQREGLADV
ncbi:hypothetical protein H0O03_04835 [Candidatus Micrarchaeota archaeon]|nr:hypothetical protein [Candidatus Micrarchaeota archaeon]